MKKPKKQRRNSNFRNTSNENQLELQLQTYQYFPSLIYSINLEEFLDITSEVSEEYFDDNIEVDEVYPVKMSGSLENDPRLQDFCSIILNLGWDILNEQGYDMDNFRVVFSSMWTQQHNKYSSMEQHVHNGDQLVGFYILKAPKGASRPVFYDPRPAKVITDLPEKQSNSINAATSVINFDPVPGKMFITNTYLPHSFTRNSSDEPTEFIHFNLRVIPYVKPNYEVEII